MAALQGLAAYASDSDAGEPEVPPKRRRQAGSFFDAAAVSSSEEEEEAVAGKAVAELSVEPPKPVSTLPAFVDLFDSVTQPPEFLRPEATQQLATLSTHPQAGAALHPLLGGGRGGSHAVVGAAPKRYSDAEAAQREALTTLRREQAAAAAASAAQQATRPKGGRDFASPAMAVEELMANPSLNAPRQKQERKDREKAKREKGQSAIGSWKSEAEMVLRQQFDS